MHSSSLALAFVSAAPLATAQCPTLVDIDVGALPNGSTPVLAEGATSTGAFLVAEQSNTGREPYWFDGQSLVGPLEVNPGPGHGALPIGLEADFAYGVVGGQPVAVFTGDGGGQNWEPWITDGTQAGTRLLADVRPGPQSSLPANYTFANGLVFFTAVGDPADGYELWVSDGTPTGTRLVQDTCFQNCTGAPSHELMALDRGVVFVGDDGVRGAELWFTDGTAGGTALLKDINPGGAGSNIGDFERVGDHVYFRAFAPGVGAEFWRTDGTPAGTTLLGDLVPGTGEGAGPFLGFGFGKLFYEGFAVGVGKELFAIDVATGTAGLVADLAPGNFGSAPGEVVALPGGLLVACRTEAAQLHGTLFWLPWDGAALGAPVNLTPAPSVTALDDLTVLGAGVYFTADSPALGRELYFVEPGVGAVQLVCDLEPGAVGSGPQSLTVVDDKLIFRARTLPQGYELHILDPQRAAASVVRPEDGWTTLRMSPPVLGGDVLLEFQGARADALTAVGFGAPLDQPQPLVSIVPELAWTAPGSATVATLIAGTGATRTLPVPPVPAFAGLRLVAQAYTSPGHLTVFELSNAVHLVLGN